jgi:hypothetical protein
MEGPERRNTTTRRLSRLRQPASRHAALIQVKNAAYAWRQAIFLLSYFDPAHQLGQARQLAEDSAGTPFGRAADGLTHIIAGGQFSADGTISGGSGRRFLRWARGPHWYLQQPSPSAVPVPDREVYSKRSPGRRSARPVRKSKLPNQDQDPLISNGPWFHHRTAHQTPDSGVTSPGPIAASVDVSPAVPGPVPGTAPAARPAADRPSAPAAAASPPPAPRGPTHPPPERGASTAVSSEAVRLAA